MKKLFVPILVLTLIVGFGALTLGTVESSGSQTLTVNVSSTYSLSLSTSSIDLTVGPSTTDSTTKNNELSFSYNNTTASKVTLTVSKDSGTWPTNLTLTIDPKTDSDTNGGTEHTMPGLTGTDSATIIDTMNDPDTYNTDLSYEASSVSWGQPAANSVLGLTLTYKMVNAGG